MSLFTEKVTHFFKYKHTSLMSCPSKVYLILVWELELEANMTVHLRFMTKLYPVISAQRVLVAT